MTRNQDRDAPMARGGHRTARRRVPAEDRRSVVDNEDRRERERRAGGARVMRSCE